MCKLERRIIEDLMVERLEKNRLIAVSGMSIEELTDAFTKGYRLVSPKAAKDDVPDDLRIAPKNTTNWIPVSERLPEDIRPVIVTWKNNDPASYYQYIVGKHFIGVAHYLKGKWYWYSSTTEDFLAEYGRYEGEEFDEAIEVIAWMPLPKPYEPQERSDKE